MRKTTVECIDDDAIGRMSPTKQNLAYEPLDPSFTDGATYTQKAAASISISKRDRIGTRVYVAISTTFDASAWFPTKR